MINHPSTNQREALVVSTRLSSRPLLLAGTAILAMSMLTAASAQQQSAAQPSPATQAQTPSGVAGQLHTVEQSLRLAQQQLSGSQQPNFAQARTAVQAGRDVLGRLPQQAQSPDAFRSAQRELDEASQALQGQQPNQQQVSTQIREAADAVASLMRGMGGIAAAGQTGGAGTAAGSGAQINVQQQPPQINVQQPAPQVTVQQAAPQVTIQQPAPQVTVQQAQPQVTVQQARPEVTVQQARPEVTVQQARPEVTVQQARPEVTVQQARPEVRVQQAQPQVNVERQGTPQVNIQRSGQPQAAGEQANVASRSTGVDLQRVQNLIGTNVVGSNGRDAGEVENLLMDSSGRVRAAVIEWGGFLGIGEREALVPIERIRLGGNQNERAQLTMTREELEALPRYDRTKVIDYGRERGWGDGLRMYR